jgi:hypothetical protein
MSDLKNTKSNSSIMNKNQIQSAKSKSSNITSYDASKDYEEYIISNKINSLKKEIDTTIHENKC